MLLLVGTRREGSLRSERRCSDGTEIIVCLLNCLLLFLLQLHGAHSPDSLFSFDSLFLSGLKNFLVLDAKLTALDIEPI